jgi:predicted ribosome quality control (RQC) complex YloA/Tae2 family protein
MDLEIDFEKSLEENASAYFEKSKQAKGKLAGLRKAMLSMDKKISKVKEKSPQKLARKAKRLWFQSFHWFRTSSGHLVIAGRDAKSNEAIVKKHLDEQDLFFHADIQGAASTVIKAEGKKIPKQALEEAAQFAAVRSKAWQQRLASVDVYAVSKEQVSKKAKAGEALATGAFMIYGKRQWFRKTPLKIAIGLLSEKDSFAVMAGPPTAVKKNCSPSFELSFGKKKKSELAKQLLAKFEQKAGKGLVSLDEIVSVLPSDGLEMA